MSTQAIGATATAPVEGDSIAVVHPLPAPSSAADDVAKPTGLHSPPDSNNAMKFDGSDSELSDLDDVIAEQLKLDEPEPVPEDDIGNVEPDHYSGTVPVFKPTMHQFKDFKKFMEKIDKYGMKSGIVKIIPPQEWKDSLLPVDDLVKTVRIREPIKQDIMGSNGTYRQVNFLHQRSYNLPQWRQLCDQSEHQPPARRGERRANAEKPKPVPRTRSAAAATSTRSSTPRRSRRGRPAKKKLENADEAASEHEGRPMTPESPKPDEETPVQNKVVASVEDDPGIKVEDDDDCDATPTAPRRMGFTRQSAAKTQSTSARRKYAKRESSAKIDEEAFKDWDYRMDVSDFTPERCEELERTYWRTLTYAAPLYGADMQGSMFHESTELWNLNKLPNLLDVLGTKVPGVNTAYLYMGMWKATFAWHLEDVDLYSINYLHFGAPKQWYSISQGDARRFEAAMKNIWPTDAKACDQFLRHKAFLISPTHLQQHYNIKVNKCVSYPGEFVVTYPYGYHSGYNLGYNCAEAVNFALDSWLPMGKIAKKCECAQAQDSVWVDVYEIERKLRGESTEYEFTDDEEDEEEEDIEMDDASLGQPAGRVRIKTQTRKRKRATGEKGGKPAKKIRLRLKPHVEPPCCLCPNDIPGLEILPTDDGRKAHRLCALYLPETYIETDDDKEIVTNVANIEKARLELRCMYCRSKRGACFQCSQRKCARSYHATCAAAAGVFVEEAGVPVFGEDGQEYSEQAFEFTCRFQRTKRDKKLVGDTLEKNARVREGAKALKKGEMCQMQYYRGDIFAGVVVENRRDEETLLLDIMPNGDRVEVEWKWLLLPDPSDYRLPKASPNAIPMPTTRKAKALINAKKRPAKEVPHAEDNFVEGFTWAEFHTCEASECSNREQVKIDFLQDNQIWHYLGKGSTESKPQYTEDPAKPVHNVKSNFLDTIPKPIIHKPLQAPARRSYTAINPPYVPHSAARPEKPYIYKPRKPLDSVLGTPFSHQRFAPRPPGEQLSFGTDPLFTNPNQFSGDGNQAAFAANGYTTRPGDLGEASHLSHGYTSSTTSKAWPAPPPRPTQRQPMPSKAPAAKLPPSPFVVPELPAARTQLSNVQKYAFFQVHNNRDSSRYKTPYAPWGGFTNGYEGNLRAHLMTTQQVKQKPSGSSTHKRSSSFGLGGGLKGLTRPSPYLNYSTPPSSSSSASSPYASPYGPRPASSLSSYSSYDAMLAGPKMSHHSPTQTHINPFNTSPVTPVGGFDIHQAGPSPLHPAIRPQYNNIWQQNYHTAMGPSPFTHAASDVNISPPSPIRTAGVLSASPSIHPQPLSYMTSPHPPASFSTPAETPPPSESGAKQTPAEQLKLQLRRISDPPLPSSYSAPHPHIEKEVAAHAPVSSQIPASLSTSAQAPAPEPQQFERHIYQSDPRPQSHLRHDRPASVSHQPHHHPQLPPRRPAPVPDLPDVPPDSTTLVEKMMMNLRRASEMASEMTSRR